MRVCINGTGNIGTTLALVLNHFKTRLGITEVVCFKNRFLPWLQTDLDFLFSKGIRVIKGQAMDLEDVLLDVDFVFDTTANGFGLDNKPLYLKLKHLKGAIAQGSEKGFGQPYMLGMSLNLNQNKLVQIVSCHTHGITALLQLFASRTLDHLKQADFVIVRRSEDIGNHKRLVGANVVTKHLSPVSGTHHAIAVYDLFKTIGVDCKITSSDITTPSQLMHSTRV